MRDGTERALFIVIRASCMEAMAFYMNVSRLCRFSCVPTDRMVAVLYPGLLQPDSLRPPMKSADPRLILLAGLKPKKPFRFGESRSDLVCHHI